ncbi:MAG: hypothetical protein GY841_01175 [FCB group bacterium]|nr:hypothetical protein [FCB group bacterium]
MATEIHTTTGINKNVLPSVKVLISFEEMLSRYYEIIGKLEKSHLDFWKSVSMAKQTRANLYTNLHEDISKNSKAYELGRGISGPAMSLLGKINSESQRAGKANSELEAHLDFIYRVETVIFEQSTLPLLTGRTSVFRKIQAILNKIQSNQLRLIDGYIKRRRAYPEPVNRRKKLIASISQ